MKEFCIKSTKKYKKQKPKTKNKDKNAGSAMLSDVSPLLFPFIYLSKTDKLKSLGYCHHHHNNNMSVEENNLP